jgi:ribonucleases P/MRP protein subunit RPP40
MIAIINRNFCNLDKVSFKLLYKSLVRSLIEYGHSVWNPYRVGIILDLERVQKRATRMVKGCKKLSYNERLCFLELPTLAFRRARGDMIEVFKILNGYYDASVAPSLLRNYDTRTRGNALKLLHSRSRLDIRKHSFTSRIVNLWNGLPNWVVLSESVNGFKNNLDKCWASQDLYYNWEADIVNK